MAKHIILLFGLVLTLHVSVAASPLTDQAAAAYNKDDYAAAAELYLKAARVEGVSTNLYYNIGNCHYRQGHIGEAILYYEKALKVDPANNDAKENLEFVKGKANIKDEASEPYFIEKVGNLVYVHSSNAWATTAVALFLAFVALLLAYLFFDNVLLRKIGFFGGGMALLLCLCSLAITFVTKSNTINNKYAVVIVPSSTLSTSPRAPKDKTEEAFLLREGYKVQLLDSLLTSKNGQVVEGWYEVTTADEHRAWIKYADVKQI